MDTKRFWVSWWTAWEGEDITPFQYWITGELADGSKISICAVIDAESEQHVWTAVKYHFPDYEQRFCTEHALDWKPGDRFPDFEGKTSAAIN